MTDYNTQAVQANQRKIDMQDKRDAAIEKIVKEEYIDLNSGEGYAPELFEDLIPQMPYTIAQYLADASKGFGSKKNDEACMQVGQMLMDWMLTHSYGCAEESLEIRTGD